MSSKTSLLVLSLVILGGLLACAAPPTEPEVSPLIGDWRAVLTSPGGELPFTLRISQVGEAFEAQAINGSEALDLSGVEVEDDRVVLAFDWYDSEITARLAEDGTAMSGQWRKTVPDGNSTLPFAARRDDRRRFLSLAEAGIEGAAEAADSPAGQWSVEFVDEDGAEPAKAEFRQAGDRIHGTFLTPTGDYRFLEGAWEAGVLRLSTFDGAHAFLFQARLQEDGSLVGDFWSRDTYHATWTAARSDETDLPDAWTQVGLTNDEGRFDFSFPDLAGETVSLGDERFADKVVLVDIFGSWCPNCNDKAPLLAQWHREYGKQGLEIVGLAYEFSGDPERDGEQVRRFAERYGLEYLLLLAGTSDKSQAAATLPDLTAVVAFPTTVFIGRDGKVRKIFTGFTGPGTGEHYYGLVAEHTELIEGLLAEAG
ncbi:MAG: TlpA disulfide reductase family protein [Acidobacteriota bacterium]